jgi:hypothetical protein
MKADIEFIPYGEISSELPEGRWRSTRRQNRLSDHRKRSRNGPDRVFIAFSRDLDQAFTEMFRHWATQESRLLIFNEGDSSDRLISAILNLQIRKPERYYVIEGKSGAENNPQIRHACLERLLATFESNEDQDRIFDATIDNEILRVVSPRFLRMEVPISLIPQLRKATSSQRRNFEIDEDGSFVYWPDLDLHLGWSQLRQLIDPHAALKAAQKSEEFNKRYGKAVQKLREAAGLRRNEIHRLSEKQLGRIEKGECRLTTNAIVALSKAHKLDRNQFLKKLEQSLE